MICLLLGSNLGDREWNLERAKAMLAEELKADMLCSDIKETEAVGFDGPAFLNQAVCFESDVPPEALLDICQDIEVALGRPRHAAEYDASGRRIYRNRTIDIDILSYNDLEMVSDRLVLPHPQIGERPFVKELLNDITI